jgi:hypothetical protein
MKKVNIEDVLQRDKERKALNEMGFNEIIFLKDGEPLKFRPEKLIEFQQIGGQNEDFITSGFWRTALERGKG